MTRAAVLDPLAAALDQRGLDPPYELRCGFYWYIVLDNNGEEVLRVPRESKALAEALLYMVSEVGLGCIS